MCLLIYKKYCNDSCSRIIRGVIKMNKIIKKAAAMVTAL